MTTRADEFILARERLHWGVFLGPILALLLAAVLTVPMLLLQRLSMNAFSSVAPVGAPLRALVAAVMYTPGLLVLSVPVVLLAAVGIAYWSTDYVLTNKRLRFKTGWLLTKAGELPLENIESTWTVQPLLGKVFGYGTVAVTGKGGTEFPLPYIRDFERFSALLREAVETQRAGKPFPIPAAQQSSVLDRYQAAKPPEHQWGKPEPDHGQAPQDDSRYMPKG